MGQPAAIFTVDPDMLVKIGGYLKAIRATAQDAQRTLDPDDWKQFVVAASALFQKK